MGKQEVNADQQGRVDEPSASHVEEAFLDSGLMDHAICYSPTCAICRQHREVDISRALTRILRHRALDLKVEIGADGFCRLDDVLAVSRLKDIGCTREDVDRVVRESDKKRFEVHGEGPSLLIRAVQGHSIKIVDDDVLLRRLDVRDDDLPQRCVHGTYRRHLNSIISTGLIAGGGQRAGFRNHVHFVPFDPGDKRVISGMRRDCEIGVWVDLRHALEEGVPFYQSANHVILSPGAGGQISPRYFLEVKDLHSREVIWNWAQGTTPALLAASATAGAACPAASSGETPPGQIPDGEICPDLRPGLLRPDAYICAVDVEISSSRPLGMKVGIDKSTRLVVLTMQAGGVIDRWNERCRATFPLEEVRRNDVILAANGVQGDPQAIASAMMKHGGMSLVIAR